MVQLFEQIYGEKIGFEELTPTGVVPAIFAEFVCRKMKEQEKLRKCTRNRPLVQSYGDG